MHALSQLVWPAETTCNFSPLARLTLPTRMKFGAKIFYNNEPLIDKQLLFAPKVGSVWQLFEEFVLVASADKKQISFLYLFD